MFGLLLYIATKYLDLSLYCEQTYQLPLGLAASCGLSLIWLERKSLTRWDFILSSFVTKTVAGNRNTVNSNQLPVQREATSLLHCLFCYCFSSFYWRTRNEEIRLRLPEAKLYINDFILCTWIQQLVASTPPADRAWDRLGIVPKHGTAVHSTLKNLTWKHPYESIMWTKVHINSSICETWTKLYSQIQICAKIFGQPVAHDFQEAHNKSTLRLANSTISSDLSPILNAEYQLVKSLLLNTTGWSIPCCRVRSESHGCDVTCTVHLC